LAHNKTYNDRDMNIVLGIVIGLAIGIAAVQLGAIVIGPAVDLALSIVAAVLLLAALTAGALYVFREAIFRKLRLKVDAKAEDLRQPATAVVEALDRKDTASAVSASIELGTVVLAWQSQVRARQSIVAGLSALLAVLAAVLGSSLLVRQNELLKGQTDLMRAQGVVQKTLLEQQNRLITEQTYSMRAQTTAALLAGIKSEKVSASDVALLAAFGEIGFDSLEILASGEDQNAASVREVLIAIAPRLTSEQATRAFGILARNDARTLLDPLRKRAIKLGRGVPNFEGSTVGFASRDQRERQAELSEATDGERAGEDSDLALRFASARGESTMKSDFASMPPEKRVDVPGAVTRLYVADLIAGSPQRQWLDRMMQSLCPAREEVHVPALSDQLTMDIETIVKHRVDASLRIVVFESIYRWCMGASPNPARSGTGAVVAGFLTSAAQEREAAEKQSNEQ
jgi:hypothetical protein